MTINIVVGIVCSEVANTENLTDGSITDDLTAWDLDYSKTENQYYLQAESVELKEIFHKRNYQLNWLLSGDDVPKEGIKKIYNGITEVLNILESSFNAEYHLIKSDLIKPQFAFEIKNVIINGTPQELSAFEKFNNDNKELIEKFN